MDHRAAVLALRRVLLGTVVSTTGQVTLAATGNGYTRQEGSFVNDGFTVGMEVVPSGFTNNTPAVIRSLEGTTMVIEGTRPAEAAAPNRSLTVGIPLMRGWENKRIEPIAGRWYIEEDYLPGGGLVVSLGQKENTPMYVLRLSGISGNGISALYKVSAAILDSFPPKLAIPMPDGFPLRVSSDMIPYRGQLLSITPGRSDVVITIPLWKRSLAPNPN
jgi:hypothetical protein